MRRCRVSIPFFFEPSFDARIAPLDAALRLQAAGEGVKSGKRYEEIVYGDFLLGKVGGNFAKGVDGRESGGEKKGKYE